MNVHDLTVRETDSERLDVYVARRLPDVSRSSAQKLIDKGLVLVNSAVQRSGYRVQPGDRVSVSIPAPEPTRIVAEAIPLDILYEDDHLLVVNKPRGMTVHPAPGSRHGTLVNAVLAHCAELSGVGGEMRPGIVHRLDKDTSGLLVVAKTDAAHASLQQQFQKRSAGRAYLALVWGETKFNEAEVAAPIGRHPTDRQKMAVIRDTTRHTARAAVTRLTTLERYPGFTLLRARLDTGRTHQIRVHCAFIGHPVVGDPTYGGVKRAPSDAYTRSDRRELEPLIAGMAGQALHAQRLEFDHPADSRRMAFEAPAPADMTALLEWLHDRWRGARR